MSACTCDLKSVERVQLLNKRFLRTKGCFFLARPAEKSAILGSERRASLHIRLQLQRRDAQEASIRSSTQVSKLFIGAESMEEIKHIYLQRGNQCLQVEVLGKFRLSHPIKSKLQVNTALFAETEDGVGYGFFEWLPQIEISMPSRRIPRN